MCQGMSVMGNAYPASSHRKQCSTSSPAVEDQTVREGMDTERLLVEENARLRALVVQLSNLVLRNVVDQHSAPRLVPVRLPVLD